jgi:hypothetical protein
MDVQAALPMPFRCRTGSPDWHDFDPRFYDPRFYKASQRTCWRESRLHRNHAAAKHCHLLMSMSCDGASRPATAGPI